MRHQNGLMIGVGIALLAVSSTYAPHGFAQTASTQDAPPPIEALPPPTMDDPGTPAAAPTPAKHDKQTKRTLKSAITPPPLPPESAPLASSAQMGKSALEPAKGTLTSTDPTPPKPSITHSAVNSNSPTLSVADARLVGEAASVSVRTMPNGDRIEETRNGGQLTHVKVTPAKGPAYEILDTNGDGRIDQKDAPNGVQPVGWTLFKWH